MFLLFFSSSIELSFLSNVGTVLISLENKTTGETQDYVCNSSSGRMIMPVVPNSTYKMDIIVENGRSYYAVFFTESVVED